MLLEQRAERFGSGAVYSTNSKPSVPIGLIGSAARSLGSLTLAMIDLQTELVSYVTIMPNSLQALQLEKFLPYRLSVVAQLVSESLHDLYAGPFDLAVTEWRVMAALGRFAPLTASEVGQRIVMDKVAVSRAVAGLLKRGLIERAADRADRRRALLRLSARGRAVHARIVPLALEYEAKSVRGAERRGAAAVRCAERPAFHPRPDLASKPLIAAIRPPRQDGGSFGR